MIASNLITIQIIMGTMFFANSVPEEKQSYSRAIPIVTYSFEEQDDKDFDGVPDGWRKAKGKGYPAYNKVSIDRETGSDGSHQSLRFDLQRNEIAAYSSIKKIDAPHSYLLTGKIKTRALKNSAGTISISFLDSKMNRIRRDMSKFYTGTFNQWQEVIIDPVDPPKNAAYAVIGCHLVQRDKKDIRGTVWFDELQLKQLPRLTIVSNYKTHFFRPDANIIIEWNIKGLDPGKHGEGDQKKENHYTLLLEMFNNRNKERIWEERDLEPDVIYNKYGETESIDKPENHRPWKLKPKEHGFYKVKITLKNNGNEIINKSTNFTVIDIVNKIKQKNGEFGWSISQPLSVNDKNFRFSDMESIIKQGGIHWLQYPVWQSVTSAEESQKLSEFFEKVSHLNVKPVGVLDTPPHKIRSQFARNWQGVSEIFSMRPDFWNTMVESAVARYSTSIRHWQLGNNNDESFIGLSSLDSTMRSVHSEFSRIGRDTRLGMRWDWENRYPSHIKNSKTFLIMNSTYPDEYMDVFNKITDRKKISSGEKLWVVIRPLSREEAEKKFKVTESEITEHDAIEENIDFEKEIEIEEALIRKERSSDLIKRMIAAKHAKADVIIAYDIFDKDHGLLNQDGSPGILFLPWRTTALELSGAHLKGSFKLKEGSKNFVFIRGDEAIVVIWNEEATREEPIEEKIFLGTNAETARNLWDQENRLQKKQLKPHRIKVTPDPLIIKNCSAELAKWRMDVRFTNGQIASKSGFQNEGIIVKNHFNNTITFRILDIKCPSDWTISFPQESEYPVLNPQEEYHIPIQIKLGSASSIGDEDLEIHFQIEDNHQQYNIIVPRTYKIGSDGISLTVKETKLEDGRLQIEQIITNETNEAMSFKCRLFIPGKSSRKSKVIGVQGSHISKFYFLPNADELKGEELSIKATQIRGDHAFTHKWIVGETWEEDAKARKRKAHLQQLKEIREALKQKQNYSQARRDQKKLRSAQLQRNQSLKR